VASFQKNLSLSILLMGLCSVLATGCAKKAKMRTNRDEPAAANSTQAAPNYVVPGARDYQGGEFQPRTALGSEMGTWVEIPVGSDRWYFVPNRTLMQDDWAPYQHGYWTYDTDYDWSWVSYDPWGWVTEHYGIWRHHRQHGWIWMAFPDRRYQPHCVTWFDRGEDDEYIGWYPYHAGYKKHYYRGDDFDDNLWEGPRAVLNISVNFRGGRRSGFFLGITLVNRANVTAPDIFALREVRRPDYSVLNVVIRDSHRRHSDGHARIFRYPGGRRGDSLDYLRSRSNYHTHIGSARHVKTAGGAEIIIPDQREPIPQRERNRWKGWNDPEHDRVFGQGKNRGHNRNDDDNNDFTGGGHNRGQSNGGGNNGGGKKNRGHNNADNSFSGGHNKQDGDADQVTERDRRNAERKAKAQAAKEAKERQALEDAQAAEQTGGDAEEVIKNRRGNGKGGSKKKNQGESKLRGEDATQAPQQVEEDQVEEAGSGGGHGRNTDQGSGTTKKHKSEGVGNSNKNNQNQPSADLDLLTRQANQRQQAEARTNFNKKKGGQHQVQADSQSDEENLPPSAPSEDSGGSNRKKKKGFFNFGG
jgi:hypothetical protein